MLVIFWGHRLVPLGLFVMSLNQQLDLFNAFGSSITLSFAFGSSVTATWPAFNAFGSSVIVAWAVVMSLDLLLKLLDQFVIEMIVVSLVHQL